MQGNLIVYPAKALLCSGAECRTEAVRTEFPPKSMLHCARCASFVATHQTTLSTYGSLLLNAGSDLTPAPAALVGTVKFGTT